MTSPEQAERLLSYLRRRYIWWEADQPPSEERTIAQAMHLGTYDDIRLLERTLPAERLGEVMSRAQPGWFDRRSWSFWRGRLKTVSHRLPELPPSRSFDHA